MPAATWMRDIVLYSRAEMWGSNLIVYEREKLYEQIWAEPMRNVAKGYEVSDVYLARICRQLSIPIPGRGYWAKLRAGKSPRRQRLPKLKENERDKLTVWHRRRRLRGASKSAMNPSSPFRRRSKSPPR